jgi:hypothetical protein
MSLASPLRPELLLRNPERLLPSVENILAEKKYRTDDPVQNLRGAGCV